MANNGPQQHHAKVHLQAQEAGAATAREVRVVLVGSVMANSPVPKVVLVPTRGPLKLGPVAHPRVTSGPDSHAHRIPRMAAGKRPMGLGFRDRQLTLREELSHAILVEEHRRQHRPPYRQEESNRRASHHDRLGEPSHGVEA